MFVGSDADDDDDEFENMDVFEGGLDDLELDEDE